jgi:small-conductance mechanosensitive channel
MIWHKLEITVTFETPPLEAWETLERVLQAEVESAYKRFQEVHAKFTTHYKLDSSQQHPKVLCHIADSGVLFKMFYPAHYREASSTRSRIMKRILEEFARNPRLQFAYPTMRNIPTAEADGFKVRLAGRGKDE